jgi:hypothetical protein
MMSELRVTLLILGAVFIVALAWWERRRPRHASGAPERRAPPALPGEPAADLASRGAHEPLLTLPPMRARELPPPETLPIVEVEVGPPTLRAHEPEASRAAEEPGVEALLKPLLEPLLEPRLRPLQELWPELPAGAEPAPAVLAAVGEGPGAAPPAGSPRALPGEQLPQLPAGPAPVVNWPPDERRRVVTLRLVAPRPERFAGRSLRQALAAEGFVLGRFAIFHKPDEEQRAVLSAASLTRPGTFDADTMDSQHYGGLSLFAVLPGPKPPSQAFDELVSTARNLNDRLCGVLQDEQGSPLTPARIALLRERLGAGAAA